MIERKLLEAHLLQPVLTLFPESRYLHLEQVPLGRKKIDLVCLERANPGAGTSVELKLSDWREALWQAAVNLQLTDQSYIAIWHQYVHRAAREPGLLTMYRVGLIAVYQETAEVLLRSPEPVRRLSRHTKASWYTQLLAKSG